MILSLGIGRSGFAAEHGEEPSSLFVSRTWLHAGALCSADTTSPLSSENDIFRSLIGSNLCSVELN